jgi:hypothetical protein
MKNKKTLNNRIIIKIIEKFYKNITTSKIKLNKKT